MGVDFVLWRFFLNLFRNTALVAWPLCAFSWPSPCPPCPLCFLTPAPLFMLRRSAAVAIFYLVLRGLDTVEDDMSLQPSLKRQVLIDFHNKLYEPGWTFNGSGPEEKDRQLLVEFDVVRRRCSTLRCCWAAEGGGGSFSIL